METSSSLGLRNWRSDEGQIVEPLVNYAAADVAIAESEPLVPLKRVKEAIYDSDSDRDHKTTRHHTKHKKKHSKKHKKDTKKRHRRESSGDRADDVATYVKDEFGRDVLVEKVNKERKHGKQSSSRPRSRSKSPMDKSRRRPGHTPPPPDPYRPQVKP